ncbi:AraC family transcriptional regulator [Alkalimonas delamerensis]|uniref:AraC family transcriptional regulator n=1 Tax=Alkalimonas delamerensis TaxID=265981 RepID=A0ABT9GL66_9GAMM|nr:AraC family transcriptional regulator [Alkalimonas delamerensis]MDP4527684.1 AraC family transcriptional regulator [Alkalimonas delamerensis]
MTKTPALSTETPEPLEQLLAQLAFGSELHFESGFCDHWNLLTTKSSKAALHVVTQGQLWMAIPGRLQEQVLLEAGDAIFFSHSFRHWLSDEPVDEHTNEVDFANFCVPDHVERGLVCYDIAVESPLTANLFQVMPDYIHLPANQQSGRLSPLIQLIRQEAQARQPGYQAAISRLSDVVVLHLLRQVLSDDSMQQGLLAALKDPALRRVVLAIMDEPGADWTVETMAALAFLSKSAFAERCHKVMAMTAKSLLDELRLQRCRYLLIHSELSLELIAEQIGYQSATAFIRFFKQHETLSPGEFRALHH